MIPRWHFVLKTVLMITGGVLRSSSCCISQASSSFRFGKLASWFAPFSESAGWYSFFRSMPWILVALLAIFIVRACDSCKAVCFCRISTRSYIFSSASWSPSSQSAASVIAQTPLHQYLFNSSRHGRLSVLGGFYHGFGPQRLGDIHRGTVISTTTDGFILQDANGETSTAVFGARFHGSTNRIPSVGSDVVIFGPENQSGTITIQGIQPVRN